MIHAVVVLKDKVLTLDRPTHPAVEEFPWNLQITDSPTGKNCFMYLKDQEIAAILALAVGGDEIGNLTAPAYEIAEPLMHIIDPALRIIP